MSTDQEASQILWICGEYDWNNSLQSTGKAGVRICRTQSSLIIEAVHYDHEDNREYYNCGIFSIAGYLKAFQEMEATGHSVIEEGDDSLILKRVGEFVEIKLCGVLSPGNTPGGAQLSARCDLGKIHIDKLRL